MGRHNFAAQRVHQAATRLLETKRIATPPPWYDIIGSMPPSERLVRPALQGSRKRGRKASRLFQPMHINYTEDALRQDFFGDHPWELARPRTVLEDDGKDYHKHDWSTGIEQPGKQLDGESVIQRQHYLMHRKTPPPLSRSAAYDVARKEFYALRHAQDIERRVALEEALSTGAYFDASPLEYGMQLENKTYEQWRAWAQKEIAAQKQLQGAVYSGISEEEEEAIESVEERVEDEALEGAAVESGAGIAAPTRS